MWKSIVAPPPGRAPLRRGEVLRYRLAFALTRAAKVVRGLRQGLTEDERHAVAEHVVSQLKEGGDRWRLADEAPPERGPATYILSSSAGCRA